MSPNNPQSNALHQVQFDEAYLAEKQRVWDEYYNPKVASSKGKHASNYTPPKKKRKKNK